MRGDRVGRGAGGRPGHRARPRPAGPGPDARPASSGPRCTRSALEHDRARALLREAAPYIAARPGEQWPLIAPMLLFLLDDLGAAAQGLDVVISAMRRFERARPPAHAAAAVVAAGVPPRRLGPGADRGARGDVPRVLARRLRLGGGQRAGARMRGGDGASWRRRPATPRNAGATPGSASRSAPRTAGDFMIGHGRRAFGLLALGTGDFEAAAMQLRELDDMASAYGLADTPMLPWLADLAEAELAMEDRAAAATTVERVAEHAATVGTPAVRGLHLRARTLASDEPDPEALEESAGCCAARACRSRARAAGCMRARCTGGASSSAQARRQLISAFDAFDALGAAPWRERTGAELRASGAAVPDQPAAAADLTPQELQVVRLAADGESNAQIAMTLFLSKKTVEFHLGKAFRKLGVNRRSQLAKIPGLRAEDRAGSRGGTRGSARFARVLRPHAAYAPIVAWTSTSCRGRTAVFRFHDGPGGGPVDTGIMIRPGDAVTLSATGTILPGAFLGVRTSPEGWLGHPPAEDAPVPLATDANAHSLVARVGDTAVVRGPELPRVAGPSRPARRARPRLQRRLVDGGRRRRRVDDHGRGQTSHRGKDFVTPRRLWARPRPAHRQMHVAQLRSRCFPCETRPRPPGRTSRAPVELRTRDLGCLAATSTAPRRSTRCWRSCTTSRTSSRAGRSRGRRGGRVQPPVHRDHDQGGRAAGGGRFRAPAFICALDLQFALRYLAAVRGMAIDARRCRCRGRSPSTPREDASPMARMAAGVNAHINFDLPFALLAALRDAPTFPAGPRDLLDGDGGADDEPSPEYRDYCRGQRDLLRAAAPGAGVRDRPRRVPALALPARRRARTTPSMLIETARRMAWVVCENHLWPIPADERRALRRRERLIDWLVARLGAEMLGPVGHLVFAGTAEMP